MKRIALFVLAWLLLGLEIGLRSTLQLWSPIVSPSLVFILAAFVAMTAPPRTAAWWAIGLGLAVDVVSPTPLPPPGLPAVVLGPHALAFLVASHLIVSMRGVMIRRNPLTLGFLTLAGGLVAQALLLSVAFVRSYLDGAAFHAAEELGARGAGAAYTAVVGVALAFVLIPAAELLGLPSQTRPRFASGGRAG